MTTLYVQAPTLYLAGSGVVATATSVTVTDLTDIYGNVLTMADFGALGYITFEPGTTNAEGATFTGISANANGTYTLTGVKTILAKSPYTQTSGLVRNHAGGTEVVITDNVGFWNTFVNKNNAATISAIYTFDAGATPLITDAPTTPTMAANKAYVDTVTIAGGPNASTTIQGFVQLPTQTQVEAGTLRGSAATSYLVLMNQQYGARNHAGFATDGGTVNVRTVTLTPVPAAYATGMVVAIESLSTNTGNMTLNVNGLGAKTVRLGATGVFAGVMATGTVAALQYNGAQFDIVYKSDGVSATSLVNSIALRDNNADVIVPLTPTASNAAASKNYVDSITTIYKNGTASKNAADSSTTQNIAHGLGRIPKFVTITASCTGATAASDSILAFAQTMYNGTTQSSVSFYATGATFGTSGGTVANTFTLNISGASGTQTGVVTFDATNIIITWTKTNSPTGTYNLLWSAQG